MGEQARGVAEPTVPGCHRLAAPPGIACTVLALSEVAERLPADPQRSTLMQWLSAVEQRRFAELTVRKRRVEWLAGRLAAKHALQALTFEEHWPLQASVFNDAAGRPAFEGATVSISHSRHEAVAAVARVPLGVDTECYDALGADSLAMVLRREEVLAVQADWRCDPRVARTLLWCLKEALFKAAGSGAFMPFATALQVQGWPLGVRQPHWTWQPATAMPPLHLERWCADAALTAWGARVLVSPRVPIPTRPRAAMPPWPSSH